MMMTNYNVNNETLDCNDGQDLDNWAVGGISRVMETTNISCHGIQLEMKLK